MHCSALKLKHSLQAPAEAWSLRYPESGWLNLHNVQVDQLWYGS